MKGTSKLAKVAERYGATNLAEAVYKAILKEFNKNLTEDCQEGLHRASHLLLREKERLYPPEK